jgi:hypothetical protein
MARVKKLCGVHVSSWGSHRTPHVATDGCEGDGGRGRGGGGQEHAAVLILTSTLRFHHGIARIHVTLALNPKRSFEPHLQDWTDHAVPQPRVGATNTRGG